MKNYICLSANDGLCYRNSEERIITGWGVGKGLVRLELNFTGKRGEEKGAEGTTCRQIQEMFNHLKIEMVKLKKS